MAIKKLKHLSFHVLQLCNDVFIDIICHSLGGFYLLAEFDDLDGQQ